MIGNCGFFPSGGGGFRSGESPKPCGGGGSDGSGGAGRSSESFLDGAMLSLSLLGFEVAIAVVVVVVAPGSVSREDWTSEDRRESSAPPGGVVWPDLKATSESMCMLEMN